MFASKLKKSRVGQRLALTGIAVATVAGVGVGMSAPAQAAVVDQGIVTGSVYLSRAETRALSDQLQKWDGVSDGGAAAAGAAACAATGIGGVAAGACAAAATIGFGFFKDKSAEATGANGCLRIRYTTPGFTPVGLYSDHSGFCQD